METKQPKQEDQRVRLTKQLLRNAFLQLLSQKPVQSVTVKELCEAAGVNRGTFYLHYRDVYELMETLENEMLEDLDELLNQTPIIVSDASQQDASGFIGSLRRFFEKNRELCAILLGDNGDKKFLRAIIERARQKSVREYRQRFPNVTKQQAEVFYYFIAWGFIGLIQQMLLQPGEMDFGMAAAYAERIVAQAARFFTEE